MKAWQQQHDIDDDEAALLRTEVEAGNGRALQAAVGRDLGAARDLAVEAFDCDVRLSMLVGGQCY